MKKVLAGFFFLVLAAAAAGIDGRWTCEVKAAGRRAVNAKGKTATPGPLVLDLKSESGKLTGTVRSSTGKRGRQMQIQDGKLEGDSFSFVTVARGKKDDRKWTWRGALHGEEISGTRTREGARRGQPFTAKR